MNDSKLFEMIAKIGDDFRTKCLEENKSYEKESFLIGTIFGMKMEITLTFDRLNELHPFEIAETKKIAPPEEPAASKI